MGVLRLLILSFLIFGCTKHPKLEINKDGNYFFRTDQLHLRDVKLIPWVVGLTHKEVISKGFYFSLSFPQLRNEDIFTLHDKTQANSWIVRVRKSSALGNSILGYFYSPFLLPGIPGMERLRAKQIHSITIQVEYTAATISEELGRSPCPAMNHRKLISEILYDPKSDVSLGMTISPELSSILDEPISEFSYKTPTINGGTDLIGVYSFEITFFDSVSKKILGDWLEYPETFTVVKENETILEECIDYEQKKLGPDYNDFRRFKWKENMYKDLSK